MLIQSKLFAASAAVAVLAAGSAYACGKHLTPPKPPAPPAVSAIPAPPEPPPPPEVDDIPAPPEPPAPPSVDGVAYHRGELARAHADLDRAVRELTAAVEARTAAIRTQPVFDRQAIERLKTAARESARAQVDFELSRADIERIGDDARAQADFAVSRIDIEKIRADAMAAADAGRQAALDARRMTAALRPQIEAVRRQAEQLRSMCADEDDACDVDIDVDVDIDE